MLRSIFQDIAPSMGLVANSSLHYLVGSKERRGSAGWWEGPRGGCGAWYQRLLQE